MTAHVDIEGAAAFELQQAVLLYKCSNHSFATVHDVIKSEGAPPTLGAGHPVSSAFLQELSRGLGQSLRPEVLPANVLARTPDKIVWWSPARRRRMFFCKAAPEHGEMAWGHPGGLQVTVMDHDTVSAVNCVRQPFSQPGNRGITISCSGARFWPT
jgi:PRTRC genetic system protein B